MNFRRLLMVAMLAAVLVPVACVPRPQSDTPENKTEDLPELPSEPRFKTMVFTSAVETTQMALGIARVVDSGKLKTTFDTDRNRYRRDMVYTGGRWQTELFDGDNVWEIRHAEKSYRKVSERGKKHRVWEEAAEMERRAPVTETLHGTAVKRITVADSTYWVYKGVTVQSEIKTGDYIIRNTLDAPIVEDAVVEKSLFEIPAGYKRKP